MQQVGLVVIMGKTILVQHFGTADRNGMFQDWKNIMGKILI